MEYSVQFSHSVMSNSLRPHELQHAKPPCPSLTPRVHSNSCPLSQWCHPTISSSVVPFSSCPQSLTASQSFPMSQLFAWGGQSTGVSASASFPPKKSQGWSPSEWTGWISLQSRDSQESSPTPQFKSINSSALSFLHSPTLTSIHDYWKNHRLTTGLCWQSSVSAFQYAIQVGHSFSSKDQASLNFMASVTICSHFWAPQNKVCHCFHCFLMYLPCSDGTGCHDLSFLNVLRQLFHSLLSLSSRGFLVLLHFPP